MNIVKCSAVKLSSYVENVVQSGGILCEPTDFKSPLKSILDRDSGVHYSDISDDEDFQIPCSQKYLQQDIR